MLGKRQVVLAAAGMDMGGTTVADDKFAAVGLKGRAPALKMAGMPVVFN
jgi:hypothetical protein